MSRNIRRKFINPYYLSKDIDVYENFSSVKPVVENFGYVGVSSSSNESTSISNTSTSPQPPTVSPSRTEKKNHNIAQKAAKVAKVAKRIFKGMADVAATAATMLIVAVKMTAFIPFAIPLLTAAVLSCGKVDGNGNSAFKGLWELIFPPYR